jgi:hypothetical protein
MENKGFFLKNWTGDADGKPPWSPKVGILTLPSFFLASAVVGVSATTFAT